MPEKSERVPVQIRIYFDLPFVLFVKDSLRDTALEAWASAYAAGTRPLPYSKYAPAGEKPGFMAIGGGFPVYLPPEELAEPYVLRLGSLVVAIRILRRVNPHRDTVMMGEVPGDRSGRASFSSVLVFMMYNELDVALREDVRFLAQTAVDAANKLISHYRVIADRPYVRSVTVSEVQDFRVITEYEDGSEHSMEFGSGSGPMHGFGGAIEDDVDAALRAAIAEDDPPSIELTLDADIRDHLDLHEWRLALIQSGVLFEAWLAAFLRNRFAANGLDPSAIDAKFAKPSGLPKSATALAAETLRDATGFNFAGTPEFTKWCEKVRDPRNDLVHGARFNVTAAEAHEAYDAVLKAVELLSTK